MNVKELIEQLSSMDPNSEVCMADYMAVTGAVEDKSQGLVFIFDTYEDEEECECDECSCECCTQERSEEEEFEEACLRG